MRSQWKRLAIAACLSLACAGGTLLWYYGTEKRIAGNGESPLAQVSKVGDEVLRRPATRLLWQQVNTGDNLYNGETIRTSARGELRIQFEDGRYIDLEPDSLIVLQKSKGDISLDLMEGSLFVNAQSEQGAPAAGGLVLNSKNGKVDLTGASASLSKGSGDRVDLKVLEGKATLRGADGKEKEIQSGATIGANGVQASSALTILSPVAGSPYYIDPDQEKPVLFKWRGYPATWTVSVMAGPTRKEMKEIGATANAGETEVRAKLPLGKFWWKLVAKDPATGQTAAESPAARVDLQGRYAPTVIQPVADAEITIDRSPFDMVFKWQKSEDSGRVQLEVGADPQLKNLLVNRSFTKEDTLTLPALKEGEYYWRMSAYYEGSDRPVIGKVQKFRLQKQAEVKKDPVQIVWNLPQEKLSQVFVQNPQLDLSWEPKNRLEDIAGYRVKLETEGEVGGQPVAVEAKQPLVKAPVPKAGRYIASVEAYDKDGRVIGTSEPLKLAASELPLLSSPVLQPAEGVLQSGFDGRTQLSWQGVDGAKEYWLTVTDKSGKELARKKYDATTASLKNLMPGEYSVKVDAVDAYGRPSREGAPRTLVVPDKSGLKAPSLKKIKVN